MVRTRKESGRANEICDLGGAGGDLAGVHVRPYRYRTVPTLGTVCAHATTPTRYGTSQQVRNYRTGLKIIK